MLIFEDPVEVRSVHYVYVGVIDWEAWPTKTTVWSVVVGKYCRLIQPGFPEHLNLSTPIHNLDSGSMIFENLLLDFLQALVLLQFLGFF